VDSIWAPRCFGFGNFEYYLWVWLSKSCFFTGSMDPFRILVCVELKLEYVYSATGTLADSEFGHLCLTLMEASSGVLAITGPSRPHINPFKLVLPKMLVLESPSQQPAQHLQQEDLSLFLTRFNTSKGISLFGSLSLGLRKHRAPGPRQISSIKTRRGINTINIIQQTSLVFDTMMQPTESLIQ